MEAPGSNPGAEPPSFKYGAYFSYQVVQSSHTRKLFSQEAESPQLLPFCSNQPPPLFYCLNLFALSKTYEKNIYK